MKPFITLMSHLWFIYLLELVYFCFINQESAVKELILYNSKNNNEGVCDTLYIIIIIIKVFFRFNSKHFFFFLVYNGDIIKKFKKKSF